jgi:hypothetical protein
MGTPDELRLADAPSQAASDREAINSTAGAPERAALFSGNG